MAHLLVGVEVEPPLTALVLRPAVPGDRERLQTTVRKLDQVLLQRRDAERVFDLELGELSVRAVGFDKELAVAAEEARLDPVMLEGRAGKVAEDRLLRCVVHRQLVV